MKLADLRKLSIRQQYRIHFPLRNGMECVVTEHGVARVAALRGVPDFNLEDELASAVEFVLEPAAPAGKKGETAAPRIVSREELAALASPALPGSTVPGHDED